MTSAPDWALDALPYQAAIVDASGVIVRVNEAWRRFAEENGAGAELTAGVGLNYLATCRNACGRNADESQLATRSFERVSAGDISAVSFQYPCHSSTEQRWFVCATGRIEGDTGRLLVAHIHLGERRAMRSLPGTTRPQAGENRKTGMSPDYGRPRELGLYQQVQEMTGTGGWEWDIARDKLRWTPHAFCIHGVNPDCFTPTLESMLQCYSKRSQNHLRAAFLQAEHFGVPFELELLLVSAARRSAAIRVSGRAEIKGTTVLRLYGVVQHVNAGKRSSESRTSRRRP